ncbi:hypothetical protein D3C72_1450150 [compost metagenome]
MPDVVAKTCGHAIDQTVFVEEAFNQLTRTCNAGTVGIGETHFRAITGDRDKGFDGGFGIVQYYSGDILGLHTHGCALSAHWLFQGVERLPRYRTGEKTSGFRGVRRD